jgi:hypothetical protein
MNENQWNILAKVATIIWPVVTGLIGVFIGGYIANQNQHKQWVAENKKTEYRELIAALNKAFYAMLHRIPGL